LNAIRRRKIAATPKNRAARARLPIRTDRTECGIKVPHRLQDFPNPIGSSGEFVDISQKQREHNAKLIFAKEKTNVFPLYSDPSHKNYVYHPS